MENYSIKIKGGNTCDVKIKANNVFTIYNISLSKTKEKKNAIQLMYSTNKGTNGMIGYLSEKADICQMQMKLEILPNTVVCFEAIGEGEIYLNGVIYTFDNETKSEN